MKASVAVLVCILFFLLIASLLGFSVSSQTPGLRGWVGQQVRFIPQQSMPPGQPVVPPAPTPAASGMTPLTPAEVQSWCHARAGSSAKCDLSRFEPLVEQSAGLVNPFGVHMQTGDAVAIDLPAQVAADVWNCFQAMHIEGPAHLDQVCEMSVRRSG